ncbi:MAG: AEC family transporter [Coriobacteriia bacterium]|jgi:Predicted permeases
MEVGQLLSVIGGVLGYFALGMALRVTGLMKAEHAHPLNALLIYVALPALIFTTVQKAALDPALGLLPLVGWGVVVIGLAIGWALARLLGLKGPVAGAFMLAAAFGNTGYIGYPLASALLGDAGLVRAIFYDVFGNTAAVITIGTFIASRYGEHDEQVDPVREVVTFPPFIALAAALALRSVTVPIAVGDWLDALGKLVVPMIMISVGLSLRPSKLKGHLRDVVAVAGIKLLVLPAVALAAGSLVFSSAESLRVAVIEAGVPTMMLTMVIGMRFKLDTDLIASAILVTMTGAIVTIPLFQLLIG